MEKISPYAQQLIDIAEEHLVSLSLHTKSQLQIRLDPTSTSFLPTHIILAIDNGLYNNAVGDNHLLPPLTTRRNTPIYVVKDCDDSTTPSISPSVTPPNIPPSSPTKTTNFLYPHTWSRAHTTYPPLIVQPPIHHCPILLLILHLVLRNDFSPPIRSDPVLTYRSR